MGLIYGPEPAPSAPCGGMFPAPLTTNPRRKNAPCHATRHHQTPHGAAEEQRHGSGRREQGQRWSSGGTPRGLKSRHCAAPKAPCAVGEIRLVGWCYPCGHWGGDEPFHLLNCPTSGTTLSPSELVKQLPQSSGLEVSTAERIDGVAYDETCKP